MENKIKLFWERHIKIKPWIVLAATLAVGIIAYVGFLGFRQWNDSKLLDDLKSDFARVQSRSLDAGAFEAYLDSQLRRVEEITASFTFVNDDHLTATIADIGYKSGVDVTFIEAKPTTSKELDGIRYQRHQYIIEIAGILPNMLVFLMNITQEIPTTEVTIFSASNLGRGAEARIELAVHLSPDNSPKTSQKN